MYHEYFRVHPYCSMAQYFILFHCQILFHGLWMPHSISRWSFGLFHFWLLWIIIVEHECTGFCVDAFFFLLGEYLGMELPDIRQLTCRRTVELFCKGAAPFCIVTSTVWTGSAFSTSYPTLVVISLCPGCGNHCEMVTQCNLHFPNDSWCWMRFNVFFGHLCIFFGLC